MISKLSGIVFVVAMAAACYALASGFGPAPFYDAEGAPPTSQQGMNMQTVNADQAQTSAPDDASVAKDKQASPLIQAQD
jgi:hypothetical protein